MGDAYTQVGYSSSSVGWGRKAAVLVVDWQTAFTDPKYPLGGLSRLHAARDNTAALLQAARANKAPVAACYTAYCSSKDMPHWKVRAVRDDFYYGHDCTRIDPKIFDARDFTYCKNAPSMFFQTPLITFLVRENVDTVVVTGRCVFVWLSRADRRRLLRRRGRGSAQRCAARLRQALRRHHDAHNG
jgi:maleamate amidohydrolase